MCTLPGLERLQHVRPLIPKSHPRRQGLQLWVYLEFGPAVMEDQYVQFDGSTEHNVAPAKYGAGCGFP